ncbi:hypothetical protein GCM10011369_00100 [Neiella marina]|uniref:GH26 domain-containing protein n=1 Tax=Neiella marina TaxID=508461 RepID=A0A8J2U1I3_9GAMM|nr:glycosyl hydrolase [Neiella marina]GGA62823.1 hypothetical protein GCM10011369_00100 [Neiella marina]
MKFLKTILLATTSGLLSLSTMATPVIDGKYTPKDGKTLMIIGQELSALRGYQQSNCCPTPGGVTTYLGIYKLNDDKQTFGGIGFDNDLKEDKREADWGGGPSNALTTIKMFPNSALAIGLSMTEAEQANGLSMLVEGKFDASIKKLATLIKMHPQPVFLRIGYEFDGAWNQGYHDTKKYIAAYRYIADMVRAEGADNAVMTWQASSSPADDTIDGGIEDIRNWYPGDDYVDWMGLSWFLRPDQQGGNKDIPSTQISLADEVLVFARERNKPVLIAEASPQGYHIGDLYTANIGPVVDGPAGENRQAITAAQIWQQWFEPFFDYVRSNNDVIRGVAYINTHWDSQPMWGTPYNSGFWGDSRIEANPEIMKNWQQTMAEPMWLHGGEALKQQLHSAK